MRTRLLHLRDVLKSGYWFLPLLLAVGAVLLAEVCLALDRAIPDALLENSRWLYVADLDALRTTLITVATVTLGTAGVVFSLTTVPLTVAASQFGSRLLRNFLRDTLTQVVLGAYFATSVYCVVVLFSLPNSSRPTNLPYISTTISLALALTAFLLLVFFINNIGVSLQAPVVIAEVSDDLTQAISYYTNDLCAALSGTPLPVADREDRWRQAQADGVRLVARSTGYTQAIDVERLTTLAVENDCVIAVAVTVGQFVATGDTVGYLMRQQGALPDEAKDQAESILNKALYIGMRRVPAQDVEFAINQLVEIAIRAQSPAINDPFTAMSCLDRLGVGLSHLAGKAACVSYRPDPTGSVRVLYRLPGFEPLCDAAFHLIRQYGRSNADVLLRMLDALERVKRHAQSPEECAAVEKHIRLVVAEADGTNLPNTHDAARVRQRAVASGSSSTLENP